MPKSPAASYWSASRSPRYSVLFAFPLLALYEALAILLNQDAVGGVRNGADVLLKSLFSVLGGRDGLAVFALVLVGTGIFIVWRDVRAHRGDLRLAVFAGMGLESIAYALVLGLVAGALTSMLLHGTLVIPGSARGPRLDLATQLVVSLGAGIYEELLFRVLVVGTLAWGAQRVLGWKPAAAGAFAAALGALIFSAFHYVGPYGDRLTLASFTFRAVAGLLFSGLYLLRGFGITAWSHALYDVILSLSR